MITLAATRVREFPGEAMVSRSAAESYFYNSLTKKPHDSIKGHARRKITIFVTLQGVEYC